MTMSISQQAEVKERCLKHKVDVTKAKMKGMQEEVDNASTAYQRGYLKGREDGKARGSDDFNDGLRVGGVLATDTLHKPLMIPMTIETRKRLASKLLEPFD